MKKVLLVSNHNLLNDLYKFNFEMYLNTLTYHCGKVEEIEGHLTGPQSYDVIVGLASFGQDDLGKTILNLLGSHELEIPLIIIGNSKFAEDKERVSILPADFNIQKLLKTMASVLGVTAEGMAQLKLPEYYPLPLRLFGHVEKSPCDIFLKIAEGDPPEYGQIAAKGSSMSAKSYADQGVKNLFIPSEMRLFFIKDMSKNVLKKLKSEIEDVGEAIATSEAGFNIVATRLVSNEKMNSEMMEISRNCIKHMNSVSEEMPKLQDLLKKLLENQCGFLYTHMIMGGFIAKHIIENASWGTEEHVDKVSFCFFFHDILLVGLYEKHSEYQFEEDILFSDELTQKEKEIAQMHAKLTGQLVTQWQNCPLGADAIITQHHGMTSGEGIAFTYGEEISPLAKVMIVSEEACCAVLRQKDEGAKEIDKKRMIAELKEKFPRATYKKFVESLATLEL